MKDSVVIDTPTEFTERAVPLLKEYLGKFRRFTTKLRALREEHERVEKDENMKYVIVAEYHALEQYFTRVQPAVRQFAQQVSGMVDQGKLSPLSRVELQVRLAELESSLLEMPRLINAYRPR